MEIREGDVVTIEFSLRNSDGEVLESTAAQGPISFKLGSDRMLPGVAQAITGMKIGEQREGRIAPGALVPLDALPPRRVLLSEFPPGVKPGLGDRFQAKDADGKPVTFEVVKQTDEAVEVVLLHPLHDTEVHYEVKVLAARKSNLPPPPPVDLPDLTDELLEGE